MRRVAVILSAIAFFFICGGHWVVLQGVAWTGMLVEYSQAYGLKQGIRRTFDGEHPCPLCRKIAVGEKKESGKLPSHFASRPTVLKAISLEQDTLQKPLIAGEMDFSPFTVRWSSVPVQPELPPPQVTRLS